MGEPEIQRYEKRGARRYQLSVPVVLPSGRGLTRDVSGCGVCFETTADLELGPIWFTIAFDEGAADLGPMRCTGRIVRIEEKRSRRLVAARIDRAEF